MVHRVSGAVVAGCCRDEHTGQGGAIERLLHDVVRGVGRAADREVDCVDAILHRLVDGSHRVSRGALVHGDRRARREVTEADLVGRDAGARRHARCQAEIHSLDRDRDEAVAGRCRGCVIAVAAERRKVVTGRIERRPVQNVAARQQVRVVVLRADQLVVARCRRDESVARDAAAGEGGGRRSIGQGAAAERGRTGTVDMVGIGRALGPDAQVHVAEHHALALDDHAVRIELRPDATGCRQAEEDRRGHGDRAKQLIFGDGCDAGVQRERCGLRRGQSGGKSVDDRVELRNGRRGADRGQHRQLQVAQIAAVGQSRGSA